MRILDLVEKSNGAARKKDLIGKLREMETIRPVAKFELSPAATHSQLRALLDPLERDWALRDCGTQWALYQSDTNRPGKDWTPSLQVIERVCGLNDVILPLSDYHCLFSNPLK